MFKWFWTIFSSGAPEKFLGNICSLEQLFYSKKSLGAPERESKPWSCEAESESMDSHTVGSYMSHGTKGSWRVFESTFDWNISDQPDTLWKWYISKELGAEPSCIKRCWVSLPPPPSPLPRWGREFGKETTQAAIFHFFCFTPFPSEASTIIGEPKTLELMLSLEPQAPVVTLIIT